MFTTLKRRLRDSRGAYRALAPVFGVYRNAVMSLARLAGIDPELAVFSAMDCAAYADNPRFISEALHALRPQTKIVWLFKDTQTARARFDLPDYVICRKSISNRGVMDMARARVVVDNFNKRWYLRFPKKGQIYFQAWHGDRAFKKIGLDTDPDRPMPREHFASVSMTGSDYGDMQFRSAFRYQGRLMRVGYPRNDSLIRSDPAEKRAVRERLGIDGNTGILLFAPTYRDSRSSKGLKEDVQLDLSRTLDAFEKKTAKRWIALTRAHYLSKGLSGAENDARIRSASDYPEMSELLLVADALITDYSSCAGDFALTGRPIFLYQADLEAYQSERALYFDMEDSPYFAAKGQRELEKLIAEMTPEKAEENDKAILDFYGTTETGRAAQIAAKYIAGHLGKENLKKTAEEGLPKGEGVRNSQFAMPVRAFVSAPGRKR